MISSVESWLSSGSIIPFWFVQSISSFILHIPVLPSQGASPPVIAQRQGSRGPARRSHRQPSGKSCRGCQHAAGEPGCPLQGPDLRRRSSRAPAGRSQPESSALSALQLHPCQGTGGRAPKLPRGYCPAVCRPHHVPPRQGKRVLRKGSEGTIFPPFYLLPSAVGGDPVITLITQTGQTPPCCRGGSPTSCTHAAPWKWPHPRAAPPLPVTSPDQTGRALPSLAGGQTSLKPGGQTSLKPSFTAGCH